MSTDLMTRLERRLADLARHHATLAQVLADQQRRVQAESLKGQLRPGGDPIIAALICSQLLIEREIVQTRSWVTEAAVRQGAC